MYHTILKGVVMGFFDKLFGRNHKQQEEEPHISSTKAHKYEQQDEEPRTSSTKTHKYEQQDEEFTVIINTDRELSEEEQKTILSILKNGLYIENQHPADVCISVMLELNIMDPIIYNRRSDECVELSFSF